MNIRYKTGFIAIAVVTAVLLSGNIQAAVSTVESNHALVKLVDSGTPLHASQSTLDSACAFVNAGNIESIAVDPAANLYVQLGPGGDPSADSCIFSVDGAGVTTLINGSTGFGINTRGTDMLYDPSSGLLVTMDDNDGQFGRIATVTTSAPGTIGTYATNPANSGFFGATFGGGFSAGNGDVAAGQLVYTADLSGNGIWSSGSGGPIVNHVTPSGAGDDMVLQSNGNWVHLGDGSCTATAFSSSPPHNSNASPIDLCGMYGDVGLSFIFGTRGAVCEATGEVYVSFSGGNGGTGIFRLNEALTTATHVVTISGTDRLHDLIVGPARNGNNKSLYFTVHDSEISTEEVWELTIPECREPIPVPVDSPWALLALVMLLLGSGVFIRQRS